MSDSALNYCLFLNGTDPEHGGRTFLQKFVTSYQSKRHYIPQKLNLVITFKPRKYYPSILRRNGLCVVFAILQNKPLLKQSLPTNYHTTNKCTNCMSSILNYFFKTLSLLLHVSIAYRLSSSGSTYSS